MSRDEFLSPVSYGISAQRYAEALQSYSLFVWRYRQQDVEAFDFGVALRALGFEDRFVKIAACPAQA